MKLTEILFRSISVFYASSKLLIQAVVPEAISIARLLSVFYLRPITSIAERAIKQQTNEKRKTGGELIKAAR